MKLNKKIIFFLALMSLFYCVSLMQETYAKYVSSAGANTSLTIARWNVLVNTADIVNNSNFSNYVVPQFAGTTHIRYGKIAPTAEGFFDIVINGTDTDVSFSYTITIDQGLTNTVSDLKISKYTIGNVDYNYTAPITGTILLADANRTKTIRVYVEWDDNVATQTMDNEDDTQASVDGVAAMDVSVNVTQLQ